MLRSIRHLLKDSFRASLGRLARWQRTAPPRMLRSVLRVAELEGRDVPATFYVTNGNDSGAGSLREAFEDAEALGNQNLIIIDDSVGGIGLDSPLSEGPINMTVLEIRTENDAITSITGDYAYRFIDHSGNNGIQILLSNLSFTGFSGVAAGLDTGDGGVIRTVAPLTLDTCTFTMNTADGDGGAIFAEYTLDITECVFDSNFAGGSGGAIYCQPENTGAGIIINDSQFTSNFTYNGDGGAIYFYTVQGTLGIYGDTNFLTNFTNNGRGGAVYQYGGTIHAVTDEGSGFFDNSDAGHGSALYLTELANAHIDADVDGDVQYLIYLYRTNPPTQHTFWTDIEESRVSGGTNSIDTNWPI